MLEYFVDQASVDETVGHLENVRLRIFEQVRLGMGEAMDGLGATAIEAAASAGIQSRTGQLDEGLTWHRIQENRQVIVGTISPRRKMTLKGRTFEGFVGTALDEGFHVPAVTDKMLKFTEPDETTLYSRGHVAFDVKPHPFMRAAVERYAPTLIEIIQERVAAATEAA